MRIPKNSRNYTVKILLNALMKCFRFLVLKNVKEYLLLQKFESKRRPIHVKFHFLLTELVMYGTLTCAIVI